MRLILFRHGLAADREEWEGPDEARPLTRKGRRRTCIAARGLAALGVAPDAVLHSSLLRAEQSARIAACQLGVSRKRLQVSAALGPEQDPGLLLKELAKLGAEQVLCVGHAPHLDRVLARLGARGLELKKAGAACVELDVPGKGEGQLEWLLGPRELRRLGRR